MPDDGNSFLKLYDGNDTNLKDYIQIDLSGLSSELANCDQMSIQRRKGNNAWNEVISYSGNNGSYIDPNQILIDYFVEEGTKYSYRISYYDVATCQCKTTRSYSIIAGKGNGELSITPGEATFNSETNKIVFSQEPVFSYNLPISFQNTYVAEYCLYRNSNYYSIAFFIENGNINVISSISELNESSRNDFLGKTLTPGNYCIAFSTQINGTYITYSKTVAPTGLPNITIPNNLE